MNPERLFLIFLCSVMLASCATHSDRVGAEGGGEDAESGSIQASGSAQTKYQVIKESFDQAKRPADLNDFDQLDEPHPLIRCLSTRASEPDKLNEVVIRQMTVSFPEIPSYGPLFPGTPERIETTLAIGKNNGWVNSKNLTNDKRQVFELHLLGNTLILKIVENQFGIYQDLGNPAEVWLRKGRGGNVFFKVFKIDAEQNRNEAFVGYCFRK